MFYKKDGDDNARRSQDENLEEVGIDVDIEEDDGVESDVIPQIIPNKKEKA